MNKILTKIQKRYLRRRRVRSRVYGTSLRPRLNVFRSLRGMYVQLIDDENGKTIVSVNAKKDADVKLAGERKGKVAVAYSLGLALAKKAQEKNIKQVVFDRAGYKYHGRVKAVAEGARDGGLEF